MDNRGGMTVGWLGQPFFEINGDGIVRADVNVFIKNWGHILNSAASTSPLLFLTTIHFDRCFSGEKNLLLTAIPSMHPGEPECLHSTET